MKLQPNIGSDRSWVWKVAADYSEDPPTAETLAIRFANADCTYNLSPHFLILTSITQTRRSSRQRSNKPETTTRSWLAALQTPSMSSRINLKRMQSPKTGVRQRRMRPHLARRIRLLQGQVRKRKKNKTGWSCSSHEFFTYHYATCAVS